MANAFTTYQGSRWKIWSVAVVDETTDARARNHHTTNEKGAMDRLWSTDSFSFRRATTSWKGRQSIAAFLNGTGQHIQLGDKVGTHEA